MQAAMRYEVKGAQVDEKKPSNELLLRYRGIILARSNALQCRYLLLNFRRISEYNSLKSPPGY